VVPPGPTTPVVGAWSWGVGGGGGGVGIRQEKPNSFLDDILEDVTIPVPPCSVYVIATLPTIKSVNYIGEQEDEELILMAMAKFGMLGEFSNA
jgi:hypothetical protein